MSGAEALALPDMAAEILAAMSGPPTDRHIEFYLLRSLVAPDIEKWDCDDMRLPALVVTQAISGGNS